MDKFVRGDKGVSPNLIEVDKWQHIFSKGDSNIHMQNNDAFPRNVIVAQSKLK